MREHGSSATPRVRRFTQLIAELVHEIFFVPPGFNNVAAGETLSDEYSEASEDGDDLTDSEFFLVSERARDPNRFAFRASDSLCLKGNVHQQDTIDTCEIRERFPSVVLTLLQIFVNLNTVSTYFNDICNEKDKTQRRFLSVLTSLTWMLPGVNGESKW